MKKDQFTILLKQEMKLSVSNRLSKDEKSAAKLFIKNYTVEEIAKSLGFKPSTIYKYRTRIIEKLGLNKKSINSNRIKGKNRMQDWIERYRMQG